MSPKKKADSGMKQVKLDFTAAKRTASSAAGGKAKAIGSTTPVAAHAAPAKPARSATSIAVESPARVTRAKPARQEQVADVLDVDEDVDDIESAEDFTGSDSESLSSVSTFETVESVKVAPVPTTPSASAASGRTTRSSAKELELTPKVEMDGSGKSPAKAKMKVKEDVVPVDEIMEDEEESANLKSTTIFKPSNATDAEVAKRVEANIAKEDPLELRVKAVKWRKYHDNLKQKYGDLPTIHGENENKIHQILRYFDNIYEYGPCVGVTRRERWDRAQTLGLNPPKEVDDILNTIEGRTKDEYVQSVFYGQV